jgi:hypothetical protein
MNYLKKVNDIIFNSGNFDLVSISLKDKINYIKPAYFKGSYTKEFLSYLLYIPNYIHLIKRK